MDSQVHLQYLAGIVESVAEMKAQNLQWNWKKPQMGQQSKMNLLCIFSEQLKKIKIKPQVYNLIILFYFILKGSSESIEECK